MISQKAWRILILLALAAAIVFFTNKKTERLSPLVAEHLRCEDRSEPLGIDDSSPDFSWQLRGASPAPAYYQVIVASSREDIAAGIGTLWDSGKREEPQVVPVAYEGKPLASRQGAYWAVRFWDKEGGVSKFSDPAYFEMGLLAESDWQGSWIWSDNTASDDYSYLSTTFPALAAPVKRARLYASTVHRHEISLNGKIIAKGPNFGDAYVRYYQTIAIDPQLFKAASAESEAANMLSIKAHWYGAGQGRVPLQRGALLQLEVVLEDGSSQIIASGAGWQAHRGEWYWDKNTEGGLVQFRNSEGVPLESIDAALAPVPLFAGQDEANHAAGWNPAQIIGGVREGLQSAKLASQTTEIVEAERAPVDFRRLAPGFYLADFGKVYAATPQVFLPASLERKDVLLAPAYRLDKKGEPITTEQRTNLIYRYRSAARGAAEIIRPYWYLGMRYLGVKVRGLELDASALRLIVRHHQVADGRAVFKSSDATLNALWDLAHHSTIYGAQEQFVDTPTREQGQFSYDSYLIGLAQAQVFGERLLNKQALHDFARSQRSYKPIDGRLDAAYPNGGIVQDIADWSMIFPLWLWDFYEVSGDMEVLRQLFSAATRTGDWIASTLHPQSRLVNLGNRLSSESGLIDWPDRYLHDLAPTQKSILSGYAYAAFQAVARIAKTVGEVETGEVFERRAEAMAKAIVEHLWDETQQAFVDGLMEDGTKSTIASEQTNAMMVALGIGTPEMRNAALRRINVDQPQTSVILSRYLVAALGEQGKSETLLRYLRIPNGRNFADILKDGGTFTYEAWGGRGGTGDSESHAYGAMTIFTALIRYVAGIRCEAVRCEKFSVLPNLGDVSELELSIPTTHGVLGVHWYSSREVDLQIPPHSSGDICLPVEKIQDVLINDVRSEHAERQGACLWVKNIGPGSHQLRYSAARDASRFP